MKIKITAKCSDMFFMDLKDDKGKQVREYEGYVPKWFPNNNIQHYGDYVELTIDLSTGKILNWVPPTQTDLDSTFKINKDNDL
jgi:hypothetical protein